MYKKKIWKESLNSDGQQFYQYQQNEQLPLTLKPLNTKKTATYGVGNPVCKQYTIIKTICFSIHLNSRSHKNIIKQKIIRRYKSYLFLFEFKGFRDVGDNSSMIYVFEYLTWFYTFCTKIMNQNQISILHNFF